jgi:hypothetical protein
MQVADECGIVEARAYIVVSGGATGIYYNAILNGVINTAGSSAFPGDSAGTTSSGGQFV